jgi:hypothetical protein
MYEARGIIIKIIRLIMQRELNIDDCSRLNQKIVSEITFLMEEHRVFKRPFILNGIDYLEMLKREMS